MTFYCTLSEESCHAEIFRQGNEYSVVVRVGYDGTGDKAYSIVVCLSPAPPGDPEFIFALVEAELASENDELWIFDAQQARSIIDSQEDRKRVLAAILFAARTLLDQVKPSRFFMTPYDGYLPDKAMLKDRILNVLFKDMGYTVFQTDPYNGKVMWHANLDQ
jgi:hypothetical protein